MKKVGVMQPYLFPYIGYFQLIHSVDEFVIYDDVQWMKGGWINRNRILGSEGPEYITLPMKKDSYKKNINEREFSHAIKDAKKDILDRIKGSYEGAPYYESTYGFIERCFMNTDNIASAFVSKTLKECCRHLGMNVKFIESSNLDIKSGLNAQERIIYINKLLKADQYNNAIGGIELYDKGSFKDSSIKLYFVKSNIRRYNQHRDEFHPGLSIIDVMMFNSPSEIRQMLGEYELI